MAKHRVVIIGSGFGGLFAAKALSRADVEVTLIAKTTHHLFQPLLYQVATGVLSEGEIAPPTREILRNQRNARVLLGLVDDIDVKNRVVKWRFHNQYRETPYDTLIVAAGAARPYSGRDHFAALARGRVAIDDRLKLRTSILKAFEVAEFT
ncbi:MAG: FAD-dependent oxidoreductase, partial [Propionibacteriaceae bacterium]|nr:FAD-dependent oxidoreductase [Propionibacteriaceae bacterium]